MRVARCGQPSCLISEKRKTPQHRSKILYSFSSRVSSTTLPSVARCLPGFKNMRTAGRITCMHVHSCFAHCHNCMQFADICNMDMCAAIELYVQLCVGVVSQRCVVERLARQKQFYLASHNWGGGVHNTRVIGVVMHGELTCCIFHSWEHKGLG